MTKKKPSGDLPFTYESVMRELDKYRPTFITVKSLTEEQREFILKSRKNDKPISYPKIAELWEQIGWGKTNDMQMRNIYDQIK